MNYISQLTAFFERASGDSRLNSTHISMYMSLFQFWNFNRFQNPISISRSEVMKVSKISAIATYHKCIKELNAFGYIVYEPSYNPFKGSLVRMIDFENGIIGKSKSLSKNSTSHEQVIDRQHTTTEQALVPYINNTNISKHNKTYVENKPNGDLNFGEVGFLFATEKSSSTTKTKKEVAVQNFKAPQLWEVKLFFEERDESLEEAERFYNHYEANGWLVGGKSKMKNWNAAARNWLLNSKKFNKPLVVASVARNLSATIEKNYQDPL